MTLSVSNQLTQISSIQQTYAASAISAGATSSPVKNIDGLINQWAVQLGQTGEETAEILNISGVPSGTTINFGTSPSHTAGTAFFAHAQDTPIYQIHYDQIIFSRSTTGTGGPFSALATVNIQPDSQFTTYNDANGAATYAYYVQYYNSITGDTSGSSSAFIPGGPTFYSLQKIRQRAKDKLYSAGYIKDDTVITDWCNEALELLTNEAIKVNQAYLLGTAIIPVTSGTSGLGTLTQTDFKQAVKFEVSYDNQQTFIPTREIPIQSFSDIDFFSAYDPLHAWIGETVFKVMPPPGNTSSCFVRLTYAQRFTPLVNDSDEVPLTLKGYTTAFVEYVLSVAYGLDQKDIQQQEHFQKFQLMQDTFIKQIIPRDQTSVKMIDLIEGISGAQEDMTISSEMII